MSSRYELRRPSKLARDVRLILAIAVAAAATAARAQEAAQPDVVDLEKYVTSGIGEDPVGIFPNEPIDSVFQSIHLD